MAETYNAFKGFKIVTPTTWAGTDAVDKKGYLWFVRTKVGSVTKGDIYFGTRHYGQYDPTNASDIDELKKVLGNIPGLSGKPGIPADKKTVADIIEQTASDLSSLTTRVSTLEGKQKTDDTIHTFSGNDVEE